MKFGRRLEQDMVQDFKPHYLQYKLLKKEIKALEEQVQQPAGATDPTADESANGLLINQQITYQEFAFPGPKAHRYAILASFKPMLDAEVEKVNAFVISKVKELENRVLQLLRTSQPWKDAFGQGSSSSSQAEASDRRLSGSDIHEGQLFLEQLREEAKQIAEDLVNLDKFIRQNIIAVQKIIKKFDKRLNFDVAPWLNAQLMESTPFLKVNLDSVLIALSDAYERISGFENEFKLLTAPPKKLDPEEDAKKGISAQSFERKTTKYWVRAENLMAVKIAIIQNLPVYMFDRKMDKKPKNFLSTFDELYGTMVDSAAITSIYLDNDDMGVYHSRIKRDEGAQLFRLRWYGDAKSLPNKEYVFMERKTHHESWVNAKSVKERFPIKTKNVAGYLDGTFNAAETMQKWMKPDSKGLKLIKNDTELEKAVDLSVECQKSIVERKLKPAVRTIYRRTAFQARDHNDVRISIDTQLTLVNEKVEPSPGNEFPWCRDMVNSQIPSHDVLMFPYCILEVKLNTDSPPAWITNLLADEQQVVDCYKFSKFLTGIAYHHYEKVKELPHWFEGQVAIDPRNRFMRPEEKEKLAYEDTAKKFESEASSLHRADSNDETESSPKKKAKFPDSFEHQTIDIDAADENSPLLSGGASMGAGSRASARTRNNVSPSTVVASATGFFDGLRRRIVGGQSPGQKKPLKPTRSGRQIVKIEPKTSFANERTLINWLGSALSLVTLATLIMTSGSEIGFKAGFVFFPLAFMIIFYAGFRYAYRVWAFRNNRAQHHDDLIGPAVLIVAIASAMGIILWLMFYYNSDLPVAYPDPNGAGCLKLNSSAEPSYFAHSDVFHDSDGDTWVVGPFLLVRTRPDGASTRYEFPDWQLTSVSRPPCHSDLLFLGMERPVKQIAVFNVTSGKVFSTLDMNTYSGFNVSLKAMAFIPAGQNFQKNSNDAHLLVPSEDGAAFAFRVPTELNTCKKSGFLNPGHPLPMHVFVDTLSKGGKKGEVEEDTTLRMQMVDMIPSPKLTHGLVDEAFYKHISGMYFDTASEELFVMFGRSRVLRAFKLTSGTTSRQWYLPGTSFQWSGLSFARNTVDTSQTAVYMSQSIPGGVWQFNWSAENILDGSFPGCANVYDGDLIERIIQGNGENFRRSKMRYVEGF